MNADRLRNPASPGPAHAQTAPRTPSLHRRTQALREILSDPFAERGVHVAALVTMESDPRWKALYRIGAAAAVGVLALVPIQMFVFITNPPPDTVAGWFALFQRSPL